MKQPLAKTHPFLTSTWGWSGQEATYPWQEETTTRTPGLGFAALPVTEVTAHFHSPSAPQGRMAGSPLPAALRFRAQERPVQLRVFRNAAFSKEMQVLMFRLTYQERIGPQAN